MKCEHIYFVCKYFRIWNRIDRTIREKLLLPQFYQVLNKNASKKSIQTRKLNQPKRFNSVKIRPLHRNYEI